MEDTHMSESNQDNQQIQHQQIVTDDWIKRFDPFAKEPKIIAQLQINTHQSKTHTVEIPTISNQEEGQNRTCIKLYLLSFNNKRQRFEIDWLTSQQATLKINDTFIQVSQRGVSITHTIDNDQIDYSKINLEFTVNHPPKKQQTHILVVCQVANYKTDFEQVSLSIQQLPIFESSNSDLHEIFQIRDPLSQKKIEIPVIGKDCSHLQCFDFETYLENNRRQYLDWRCPVCSRTTFYEDLRYYKQLHDFLKDHSQLKKTDRIKIAGFQISIVDPNEGSEQNKTLQEKDQLPKESKVTEVQDQLQNKSSFECLVIIVQRTKQDSNYFKLLESTQQHDLLNIYNECTSKSIDEYFSFINKVFDAIIEYLPLTLPMNCKPTNNSTSNERLKLHCKFLYKHFKLAFIPLMFWSKISERNLIKVLSQLKYVSRFQKLPINPLLEASSYFIYKFLHKKDIIFEFVYGKIFGYQIKQVKTLEQSIKLTRFLDSAITLYPHLHLPREAFSSLHAQSVYYKTMTSFYIGLLSWFPIMFISQAFRQIFSPPTPKNKIATLEEKACLNLFVKQVILRIVKGLKLKVSEIKQLYEVWDPSGAIMRMNNGYKYGQSEQQVNQFNQLLKLQQIQARSNSKVKA